MIVKKASSVLLERLPKQGEEIQCRNAILLRDCLDPLLRLVIKKLSFSLETDWEYNQKKVKAIQI